MSQVSALETLSCHLDHGICEIGSQTYRGLEGDSVNIESDGNDPWTDFDSLTVFESDLEHFPNAFCRTLVALQTILIMNSGLQFITADSFSGCVLVTKVIINNNNISMIPANSFSSMPSLIRISLKNNKIQTIHPDAFQGLDKLRQLTISDDSSGLITLPGNLLHDLTILKSFNLKSNNLEEIPYGIFEGTKDLEHAHFSGENIQRICGNIFAIPTVLYTITLENIPCLIDSNIQAYYTWDYDDNMERILSAIKQNIYKCMDNCPITIKEC